MSSGAGVLHVEFCGEWYDVEPGQTFTIGRTGDLDIDDNPYLHRRFLELRHEQGFWVVANVGRRLGATVSDPGRVLSAHLGPGAVLPLVLERLVLLFGAGPTTYELGVVIDDAPFEAALPESPAPEGTVTIGRVTLTTDQRLMIVALAEHALRRGGSGATHLPSTAMAAERLGWTTTKFTRKLDNVCEKLEKAGVRGLRGDAEQLASNRRARLVEYSLASRLITPEDLGLLP